MATIALIGLRGSGKTAVGRELARLLGGGFLDTDELIVEAAGRTIAEIFAEKGEPEFRRLECEAVARAVAARPAVLSVGGGAVLDPQNASAIQSIATVVWLTAPPEVLLARIQADPSTAASRPPLTAAGPLEELQRLLRDRSSVYERLADQVIDTSALGVEDVARTMLRLTSDGTQ